MGAVAKTFDRIIPNEIKPIVPIAASMFGAPYLSAILPGAGAAGIMGGLRAGTIGAGTNMLAQTLMGQKIDPRSAIASGIFSGLGSGLSNLTGTGKLATAGKRVGQILSPVSYDSETGFDLTGKGEGLSAITQPATLAATTGGTIAAMDAAEKAKQEYESSLGEGQVADTAARRDYITRYMNLAGFSQEEIDNALSRAGYAEGGSTLGEKMEDMSIPYMKYKIIEAGGGGWGGKDLDDKSDIEIVEIYTGLFGENKAMGGRIGYKIGGGPVKTFIAKMMGIEPDEKVLNRLFEERKKEIFNSMFDPEVPSTNYTMQQMQEADAIATKQAMKELEDYKRRLGMEMDNPPEGTVGSDVIEQIMGPRKEGRVEEAKGGRIGYKEGGMMNLAVGGMPAEMDLRPGGFVPIGKKERADDVPARLSKNEFVMTADAVRAAGGGSVNKGAQRMYDLMNSLEARV